MNGGYEMNKRTNHKKHGLVVLNLTLLGALGLVTITPGADAQPSEVNSRVPGNYTVVGGDTISGSSSMVYVLDSANRELIALYWNDSTSSVDGVGYRDLTQDNSSDPDR
jgi:hypothetical protein